MKLLPDSTWLFLSHVYLSLHSISYFSLCRQMCEDESRKLLVGNIHVLYNPSRGDVKLGQVSTYANLSALSKW